MPPLSPKKKPVETNRPLQPKVEITDPLRAHIAAELEKADLRLQKKYAKTLVAQEEEIRRLNEELAEERKNKVNVIIGTVTPPNHNS